MEKIKDLIIKYKTFIKYIFSAGISFAIDLTLFTIFNLLFKNFIKDYSIIAATICARVISSVINYHMNRNAVFKKGDDRLADGKSFAQFAGLVVIQMCVSAGSVFGLHRLLPKINETLIKIPVECVLFLVNYFVQKVFIFKGDNDDKKKNE